MILMNTFGISNILKFVYVFILENKVETRREKDVEVKKSSTVQNQQTAIRSTEEM